MRARGLTNVADFMILQSQVMVLSSMQVILFRFGSLTIPLFSPPVQFKIVCIDDYLGYKNVICLYCLIVSPEKSSVKCINIMLFL